MTALIVVGVVILGGAAVLFSIKFWPHRCPKCGTPFTDDLKFEAHVGHGCWGE